MTGFTPPPYPYDRLHRFRHYGDDFSGGLLDFSIGTPHDPPPQAALTALAGSDTERGYPPSIGSAALLDAIAGWCDRRLGVGVDSDQVAATIGSKEFVATVPQWMRLRTPDRDTVLYPATSYPTYAMGATLAGCRAIPVTETVEGRLDLGSIAPEDIERALLIWCNSPSNPTGHLDDLAAVAQWGRAHHVPVFSDECYIDFTWDGPARSMTQSGLEGIVSVFSLSKRSNLAGVRIGYYVGDPDIVGYLREVRKHAGMMPPGPSQAAAVAALGDEVHVERQRERYLNRLTRMAEILSGWTGDSCPLPSGSFYLWVPVEDAWTFTERLARDGGALVTPGEFFGRLATRNVRVAVVQSEESIELLAQRLGQT